MRVIRTKFLPPTDTKGARIKATLVEDLQEGQKPMTKTLPYPYEGDGEESHRPTASSLLVDIADKWGNAWARTAHLNLRGYYIGKGEYIFRINF